MLLLRLASPALRASSRGVGVGAFYGSAVPLHQPAAAGMRRPAPVLIAAQARLLLASQRRRYSGGPNASRYQQQQQGRQPPVFEGIPIAPRDLPPRSTFEDSGVHSRSFVRRTLGSTSMRAVMVVAAVGALLFYFSHLEVVPVSGRQRFNCFGEDTMRMLGQLQYEALMEEAKAQQLHFLPDYDPRTLVVRHVMARLIPVSGMPNNAGDWEIVVIDDPATANAFVLPGGKVFVFSGIFNIARNEDAVAAVLGHELAHNLANHHGERASSAIGSTILLTSAFLLTAGLAYFVLRPVIDLVFNTPMSRKQESEADYIGLMLMAEACFDPAEAAAFWQRMDEAQKVQPPEWISTHPSNKHRMERIREWMPTAMEKRKASACDGTRDFAERFKRALRNGIILSS